MVSFYWGDPQQPYKESEAGAIVVQVTNRAGKTTPMQLIGEAFHDPAQETDEQIPKRLKARSGRGVRTPERQARKFLFEHQEMKLLYLLLNIGVEEPNVTVSHTRGMWPEMWAIHCTGHDEKGLWLYYTCVRLIIQ